MTITERISMLLDKNGSSARQLCMATGIPTTTFSSWVTRNKEPNASAIPAIAEYLGVTTAELITGEPEKAEKLSAREKDLIGVFRSMSAYDQKMLLKAAKDLKKASADKRIILAEKDKK